MKSKDEPLTQRKAWKALAIHQKKAEKVHLREKQP